MKSRKRILAILPMIFLVAVLLSGCRLNISIGMDDYLSGAFTYEADKMERIEIYWRSGEVEIIESDSAELSVRESGTELAYTASSGRLHTTGAFERKGDLYVFGKGESKITVSSSGGNLEIR